MGRYGSIIFALLLASLAVAAGKNWSTVPLAGWTEARTLDSCTEAMTPAGETAPLPPPVPPYGTWTEQNGMVAATGLANCWSTMLLPGDQQDVTVTTRFTVAKSPGIARQMPGGCVRWGFHWGENLPGWDVGMVLGYQDPLNFYRVQLSASRGELALWDATGGFLQLIPCKVEIGVPHELAVRWRGAHFTARLDGKKVMDYWDRSLPYLHGQVGLAVWKSDVQFTQFAMAKAAGRAEKMPAHVPDFHFVPADNLLQGNAAFTMAPYSGVILLDGYEPISYFFKMTLAKDDNYVADSLIHEAVKLKPGWRPAYYNYVGPNGLKGYWRWPMLVGNLPEAFKIRESGKKLVFTFRNEIPGVGGTDYVTTVTYDTQRGVYRYEFAGTTKMAAAAKITEFELADPLPYNNRMAGPEVVHRWNPGGHRWWMYQGTDSKWARMPIQDYSVYYNAGEINTVKTPWGKFSDFLYPDPAACPLFETELKWPQPAGSRFVLSLCAWGYDFHHSQTGGDLKAGEERSFVMTYTALPPTEAQALYAQSQPIPYLQSEKRLVIPFNPTGTTFADTTTWQDPSATMAWIGGTRDDTTGHGDTFSYRLDGPGNASVHLYHYMIEQYAKRWWIRGWYKTQDLNGPGLKLRIGYFDPPPVVQNTFNLGAGTQEWKYFSFVTDVFKYRDITDVIFDTGGAGRVWIDDVAVSALSDDQHPETTGTAIEK